MMAMILVSSVFIGLVLVGLWPIVRDYSNERVRKEACERTSSTSSSSSSLEAEPSTLEGGLVADLFGQRISGSQYRRAMERLAASDDDRHPLQLPPETGSDAGKP